MLFLSVGFLNAFISRPSYSCNYSPAQPQPAIIIGEVQLFNFSDLKLFEKFPPDPEQILLFTPSRAPSVHLYSNFIKN